MVMERSMAAIMVSRAGKTQYLYKNRKNKCLTET